jgi:hypothetical protein
MRNVLITVVTAAFLSPVLVSPSQAAPSVCKGLAAEACGQNSACTWRPALVAGETITKAGTPAKRNVKAHCRKGPAAKAGSAS